MTILMSEIEKTLMFGRRKWLVTGAAGFIGSHLVEFLLKNNQEVVGIDNFSNGRISNLNEVEEKVGPLNWKRFALLEGDVVTIKSMPSSHLQQIDFILHQAALGSVPRSIVNPMATHEANVTGTLSILNFARENQVKKMVFASSSSVYGDCSEFPQREESIGQPLSPYAVSKRCGELYAHNFFKTYGTPTIGLRYFNVFGPRQMPNGPYAAVIPRWIEAMKQGLPTEIYGDGTTSRDFCFVQNVVKANILAALSNDPAALGEIFNITMGGSTSLNELFRMISNEVFRLTGQTIAEPSRNQFRPGDLRRSQADIGKAIRVLKYLPEVSVQEGLIQTIESYLLEPVGINKSLSCGSEMRR